MAPARTRRRALVAAVAAAVLTGSAVAAPAAASDAAPIDVQVLAITDLHGYLSPPADQANGTIGTSDGRTLSVGGAAYLATHLDDAAEGVDNSLRVSNGDSFTGWQWQVTMTRDEPTIEVMNALDIEVSTVGNHELDISEWFLADHMAGGACDGDPGMCFPQSDGTAFAGADFPFLAGNLTRTSDGTPPFAASYVREVRGEGGVTRKVGVIGVTTPAVERIFASYQVGALQAGEMRDAVDAEAERLAAQGVNAIVVLAHEGASTTGAFDQCSDVQGPIVELAAHASPLVDVIVGGHWHTAFSCMLPGPDGTQRPVISPGHHGRLFADIRFDVDPATGDVVPGTAAAVNIPVTRDVPADAGIAATVDYWNGVGGQRWADPLGTITADVPMTLDDSGESAMKNLVADAYRDIGGENLGTRPDLALVEPYQVRGGISHAVGTNAADAPGRVLFGEAWSAQGRGSSIVTGRLTGALIREALEQQWRTDAAGAEQYVPLGLSGVTVVANPTQPVGQRVKSVRVDGRPLLAHHSYVVSMSSRLALGMDGFAALTDPREPVRSDMDYFAFTSWWGEQDLVTPPATDRVDFRCGRAWSRPGWPVLPPNVPGGPCG